MLLFRTPFSIEFVIRNGKSLVKYEKKHPTSLPTTPGMAPLPSSIGIV